MAFHDVFFPTAVAHPLDIGTCDCDGVRIPQMNYLGFISAGLFGTWFLATIVNQFSCSWARRLTSWDYLRILPRWTFFAPNPGTSDYHLVYRQIHDDGQVTSFIEFPLRPRRWGSWFFNPEKRVTKALLDLSHMLERIVRSGNWDETNIPTSFPYICLLNFLSQCPIDAETTSIQFCLLVTRGYGDLGSPELFICSGLHSV